MLTAAALGTGACETGLGPAPSEIVLEATAETFSRDEPVLFTLSNGYENIVELRTCWYGGLEIFGAGGWKPVRRPGGAVCLGGPIPLAPGEESEPFALSHIDLSAGRYRASVAVVPYQDGYGILRLATSRPFEVR